MRVLLGASALAVALAMLPFACRSSLGGKSRKARQVPADRNRRDGPHPADRREGRGDQEIARQDQAAARLQDRALRDRSRRAPHRGRPAGHRDLRRHAQEQGLVGHRPRQGPRRRRGEGVRAVDRLHDPERRVLLQGRLPVHRRAEPRAGVPGRRVLLRGTGRRGVQCGEAGRTDPAGRGSPTTTRRASAASGRTTSSTSRSASRSTCSRRRRWSSTRRPASAASCA